MEDLNSLPVHIIPMTKTEYRGTEKKMTISYSFVKVPLGNYLIASTSKGVCFVMPGDMKWSPVETLKKHFPKAQFRCQKVTFHKMAGYLLKQQNQKVNSLPLHLYGTDFQLSVWKDLLQIPMGKVSTYLNIAQRIERPKAARAVGKAVSANPIMYLIPCHRVICSNGKLGGYHWSVETKVKFLNKEARSTQKNKQNANWEPTLF